jgi:hypothetical protein
MELTDIHGVFHHTAADYTFYSTTHEPFSKIDTMLGHEASLNKYKKAEIISYILIDNKGIKLEITPA